MDILVIIIAIFMIGIFGGGLLVRTYYWISEASKTPLRLPDQPDVKRIDDKMMKTWQLKNSKKILQGPIVPTEGLAVYNDLEVYQLFWQSHENTPGLLGLLAERCLPSDLLALAQKDPDVIYFKDILQLYYALRMLNLQGEWRHMGLLSHYVRLILQEDAFGHFTKEDAAEFKWRTWKLLEDTGKRMVDEKDRLYCIQHLRRFVSHKEGDFKIAVCPVCKKVPYSIKINKAIARLDQTVSWIKQHEKDVIRVNVFKSTLFFDFDEVEIGPCTTDQVNAFCIEAANDPSMSRRVQNISFRRLPGVDLDEQAMRNLNRIFNGEYNIQS